MKIGDRVRVLPNKKIGVVTRIDGDFIYLDNVNRPYVEEQLEVTENEFGKLLPIKRNYERRCQCVGSTKEVRKNWFIIKFRMAKSAFGRNVWVFSESSEICCANCGAFWRTKAKYVNELKNKPFEEVYEEYKRRVGASK